MDATVISFIVNFFSHGKGMGGFGFGFRYAIEGYMVRVDHIALSAVAIAAAAAICCRRRLAGAVQTVLSVVFVAGILVFAGAAVFRHGTAATGPAFAPGDVPRLVQVLGVVGLMPWLFIGFESVSNLSGEFRFPLWRSFGVMLSAIAFVAAAYALLTLIPVRASGFAPGGGFAGLALSVLILLLFLLPFFSPGAGTMGTESYLVLTVLCIVSVVCFLAALRRDHRRHFGHSPVVWLSLVAIVVLLSFLWIGKTTTGTMAKAFDDVIARHDDSFRAENRDADGGVPHVSRDWIDTLRDTERFVDRSFLRNNLVQTGTTVLVLVLLMYLFAIFRRRERELEREKERSRSLFFSSVSHDIRTPLNAVIGFSEMLRSGTLTEAERKQAVDSILVSGKTLLGLVNDILDLSKLESGRMEIVPEPTDCPRILREVMDSFRVSRNRADVELRCRFGTMPALMVDPQRLRQIAFNLVGNAVKFTEKGYVELRAFYDRKEGADAGTLRLEVEDTGCGISEEDLKRIGRDYVQFGPKSSKRTGTGLGLAICRQLTASVGGGFAVRSALGRGSTFTIEIPGIRPAPAGAAPGGETAAASPAPVPAAPDGKRRRLLLVDDVEMNLVVLQAILRRAGAFETVPAADGAAALKALETPGAAPFDAVLTDLWMPGLDGEALLRAIRANPALAGLPVVALTADVEYRSKYAEVGFDAVLLKPVTLGTVTQVLTEVLSPAAAPLAKPR